MKLIDKDSLVAELKRRKEEEVSYDEDGKSFASYADRIHYSVLDSIQDFLDTIEVKEVDLKKESLTWEDIPELLSISEQLKTSWWFMDRTKEIGTQAFWEEVLKRFKAQKGE